MDFSHLPQDDVGKYENLNMIDRGNKYNVEVNVLASFIVLIK